MDLEGAQDGTAPDLVVAAASRISPTTKFAICMVT
jgi:hypothetical protein